VLVHRHAILSTERTVVTKPLLPCPPTNCSTSLTSSAFDTNQPLLPFAPTLLVQSREVSIRHLAGCVTTSIVFSTLACSQLIQSVAVVVDCERRVPTPLLVCVCILSRWVHAAIGEEADLPALKCSSHWSLGLYLASVELTTA
jgi:hypothetical protein